MSKPLGRLGRGLGSLIPGADESPPSPSGPTVIQVSVDAISPNPYQPRHVVDSAAIDDLAASIRAHGLIQPLVVTARSGGYQLIAGERRWTAARQAGLQTVPVIVKEATAQAMLELALVENIQRADLNVLEEAEAYQQLNDDFGLTHDQIADRVGKSRVAVTNTIRLLRLETPLREAIAQGRISANHGRALLPLTADLQVRVLALVEQGDLNARQTEALVRRIQAEGRAPTPAPTPTAPDVTRLEDEFRQALGTKVDLVRGKKGGRLVIHFYSDDELQGLYDALIGGHADRDTP